MENYRVWALKTVADKDRALQTVDSYNDKINVSYNYDSEVANFKQIKQGDYAILINKTQILGIARIENIDVFDDIKIIRRCQECESTTIDKRKKLLPVYRCNKGHEFEEPREFERQVKKYSASFNGTFQKIPVKNNDLSLLRPFYLNGYNQNMSMQLLDHIALNYLAQVNLNIKQDKDLVTNSEYLSFHEEEEIFIMDDNDERVSKAILMKERKGQKTFKDKLIKRYGKQCMITGCKVYDVLDAAHISPYRGEKDNKITNGLLLRADIHRLFDLNFVGIEPHTLVIQFHPLIVDEYCEYNLKPLIISQEKRPNKGALEMKWRCFNDQLYKLQTAI